MKRTLDGQRPLHQRGHRSTSRRAKRVVLTAILLLAIAGGAAQARWNAAGSGAGSADVATLQSATVDHVVIGGPLRPLGPSAPVDVRITNPNDFAVTIQSVSIGSVTSDKVGCGGATATGLTVDVGSITGQIGPNASRNFTASASMSADSVSACQGAVFSTTFSVQAGT